MLKLLVGLFQRRKAKKKDVYSAAPLDKGIVDKIGAFPIRRSSPSPNRSSYGSSRSSSTSSDDSWPINNAMNFFTDDTPSGGSSDYNSSSNDTSSNDYGGGDFGGGGAGGEW